MKKTLVIFPAWNRNKESYKKLIKTAPENWEIYCLDYLHLGYSDRKILDFFKEQKLEKVNIFATSLGGALAIKFVNKLPVLVDRLFLVDSAGLYKRENLIASFMKILLSVSRKAEITEDTRVIVNFIRNPLVCIKLGLFAHYARLEEDARAIKVPTIVFWGDKDRLFPLWKGKKFHKLIKNSKLVVVKDGRHEWIREKPNEFWGNI